MTQPTSPLANRVALVTGASRGIGKAIFIALADAGAHVAVNYRAQAEAADAVCQSIRAMAQNCIAVQADAVHRLPAAFATIKMEPTGVTTCPFTSTFATTAKPNSRK